MFIFEALIAGTTLVSCVGCWAMVAKHRLTLQFQKQKLDHDLEVLKPPPEPAPLPPPRPEPKEPSANQQALTALLERRQELESNITQLRSSMQGYRDKSYADYRKDALSALEDARKEQQELVEEQAELLKMMQGDDDEVVPAEKPVRVDPGGPVAQRVDDSSVVYDAELHDQETGRESSA